MPDAVHTPADETDLLAAEYVVGLLDADAHAGAADKARTEPAFSAAVEAWERRLTPMILGIPSVEPSASLWRRIAARLPAAFGENRPWWDSLTLWRGATAVAAAVAAGLAFVVLSPESPTVVGPDSPPTAQPILASTRMQTEGGQILFVITFDQALNRVVVTPVAADGVPGHSHELWVVPGEGAPVSLGVMPSDASAAMTVTLPLSADASLAISVEPEGGSPTDLPTGPVVAQGKLTPL